MVQREFEAEPYPGIKVKVTVDVEVPEGWEIVHVGEEVVLHWFWLRAIKNERATPKELANLLMVMKPDGTYIDEEA